MKPNHTTLIKDKFKRLTLSREIKLNHIIQQSIKEDTDKLKLENEIIHQIEEIILNEKDEINSCVNINKNNYFDKLPYLLIGMIESTFIDEINMHKIKKYGMGIVLESNVVLVSNKNLIYDNINEDDEKKENNFQLFDIFFTMINLSEKYIKYIPEKIKVKEYFTPMNIIDENVSDEEKIANSWGLIFLEFPIGDFLNFVIKNENFIQIKHLNDSELESANFLFLDGKSIQCENNNNDDDSSSTVLLKENFYEMNLDENLIIMKNLNKEEDDTIPGVIIAYTNRKFYIVGINTNILIKINEEDQNLNRIAIRFNKETCKFINDKIKEVKINQNDIKFSIKLFKILDDEINTKKEFNQMLKNNCKNLIEFLNEIRNNSCLLNQEEKEMYNIYSKLGLNFISFIMTLIWNKISSINEERDIINLERLNIQINPGTEIIATILKNLDNLKILNLKSNNIFSRGIKNIMKPIFNSKQIFYLGRELQNLNLDNNKLSSKSMKYLRHLIKVSPNLNRLSLNHNYISTKGIKHLINSLKMKENFTHLSISFNMLEERSGKYLGEILKDLKSLKELDLQSNNLSDDGIIFILDNLKENQNLDSLYISNNNLTEKSCNSIHDLILSINNLSLLWINNNNFNFEGVKIISESFHNSNLHELNLNNVNMNESGAEILFENLKYNSSLKKLLISQNNIGDFGCEKLALYLQNQISTVINLEEENLNLGINYINLSHNNITDEGAKYLVDCIMNHTTMRELKLNSNLITDEVAELLLYAVYYNTSIIKFHLENNQTTWRDNNLDMKNVRGNIQIFY